MRQGLTLNSHSFPFTGYDNLKNNGQNAHNLIPNAKVQRINEIQTFYPIIFGKYFQRKKGATPLMDVAPNSLRCHVITL